MNYLFTGDATGLVWDFWFDFSVAESILTLSYICLTLVLLKRVGWSLDKSSLVLVCFFIITYLSKNLLAKSAVVKTLGSFSLALANSAAEDPYHQDQKSVISGLLAEEGQRYL
jgi:hypothetical protein